MKYILLVTLFMVGCSSLKTQEQIPSEDQNFNYDGFYNNLDSVNQKMRGDFFADKSLKRSLTGINKEKYLKKLKDYSKNVPLAKDLERDLEKFDVVTVTGYRTTFIFCGYSKVLGISICDDPMCTKIEKKESSTLDKTSELAIGLPVQKCN